MGFHSTSDVIRSIGVDFSVARSVWISLWPDRCGFLCGQIGVDFSGVDFSGLKFLHHMHIYRAFQSLDHASAGGALAQARIRGSGLDAWWIGAQSTVEYFC